MDRGTQQHIPAWTREQTELRIYNIASCGRPADCRQEQGVDDGAAVGLKLGLIATEYLVLFPDLSPLQDVGIVLTY